MLYCFFPVFTGHCCFFPGSRLQERLLRSIQDDTFRRIRDEGALGETLVFERDSQGNITRYKIYGNYFVKIER